MNVYRITFEHCSKSDSEIHIITNFKSAEINNAYEKGCEITGFKISDLLHEKGVLVLNEIHTTLLQNFGFCEKNGYWDFGSVEIPFRVLSGSEEYMHIYMFIAQLGNNNIKYKYTWVEELYIG